MVLQKRQQKLEIVILKLFVVHCSKIYLVVIIISVLVLLTEVAGSISNCEEKT